MMCPKLHSYLMDSLRPSDWKGFSSVWSGWMKHRWPSSLDQQPERVSVLPFSLLPHLIFFKMYSALFFLGRPTMSRTWKQWVWIFLHSFSVGHLIPNLNITVLLLTCWSSRKALTKTRQAFYGKSLLRDHEFYGVCVCVYIDYIDRFIYKQG